MKCRKLAFNAQGSKIIITTLQVRAVKIYAIIVEVLKINKNKVRKFITKIEVLPPLNVFFFFLNFTLFMIKLKVLMLFSLFYK
jgi:hypothetical protein